MEWILVVIAIAVILIVSAIYYAVRGRTGRQRLAKLSDDSRRRYAVRWRSIETRFIDSPQEAVREADQLAVAVLSERGAELHHDRVLPRSLREARRAAGGRGDNGLLRAMQNYQAILDDAVGRDTRREAEQGRMEIA